jgi:hypothetical protein
MRLVRQFAFLLAILSLAAVPIIGAGCSDQSATKPASSGGNLNVDLGQKADSKPEPSKPPAKKPRSADEGGSTTGALGVKPPKAPASDAKK